MKPFEQPTKSSKLQETPFLLERPNLILKRFIPEASLVDFHLTTSYLRQGIWLAGQAGPGVATHADVFTSPSTQQAKDGELSGTDVVHHVTFLVLEYHIVFSSQIFTDL